MKTLIAIAAAILVSGQASADQFAPWNDARVESRADAVQQDVETGPFYRDGIPAAQDAPAATQADVDIAPWYTQGRV